MVIRFICSEQLIVALFLCLPALSSEIILLDSKSLENPNMRRITSSPVVRNKTSCLYFILLLIRAREEKSVFPTMCFLSL